MRILTILAATGMLLTPIAFSNVFAASLEEGNHYEVVTPQPSSKPKITEYFNYGCGACFNAETFVKEWKKDKSENIDFEMVALELNPQWKIYVEAYYIAEMLGILEKTHTRTFHRVHVEKKPIANREQLKTFYVSLGADPKRFDQAASSFQLNTKMSAARQQAISQRVTSTPSFVVNEHYKINNGSFQSFSKLLDEISEFALK